MSPLPSALVGIPSIIADQVFSSVGNVLSDLPPSPPKLRRAGGQEIQRSEELKIA
jgi:hypothetical protein